MTLNELLAQPLNKTVCVCTTIGDGKEFLRRYYEHFALHNRLDDVSIVVVTDRKTPPTITQHAQDARKQGLDVRVLGLDEQAAFMARFPLLNSRIPFNSDNRRNIGYLYAADLGGEVIVSVDDDNFPIAEHDFVDRHGMCGTTIALPVVSSPTRWYNIITSAVTSNGTTLHPRGFPHHRRHLDAKHARDEKTVTVAMNAGLWTNHPDVDAITRIDNPARILSYRESGTTAAEQGTFITINSQNTAFHRSVLPCYYFVLQGQLVDRFGDIWQGLFAKRCVDAMGEHVTFGEPFCSHERNTHNLFRDLSQEFKAIECTQQVAEFLEQVELVGTTYADVYRDLAGKLGDYFSERHPQYTPMMQEVADTMHIWADAAEQVLSR